MINKPLINDIYAHNDNCFLYTTEELKIDVLLYKSFAVSFLLVEKKDFFKSKKVFVLFMTFATLSPLWGENVKKKIVKANVVL